MIVSIAYEPRMHDTAAAERHTSRIARAYALCRREGGWREEERARAKRDVTKKNDVTSDERTEHSPRMNARPST